MSEADYVSLRAVARERGESQAELAGLLADRGCDLWLWFDESGQRAGVLVFPEPPRRPDEYAIGPGAYPLTQGSREMLIKRLQRGDTRTEGLEMLIETDDTLGGVVTWRVRLMEQDDSVCVVVNPADLEQMPPPSEDMGASGSGHPTMRGGGNFENFSEKSIGRTSPITTFIDEQIDNGVQEWQEAWSTLREWADAKNTKPEEMTLRFLGEKPVNLRRSTAQTSKGVDHAVDYQEECLPSPKTISRQDFGRMFREALKKSRS